VIRFQTGFMHAILIASGKLQLRGALLLAIVSLWLAATAVGMTAMWQYSVVPGENAQVPTEWPTQSSIVPNARFTLLFFAHPRCPCTRASMSELERLAGDCHDQVDIHVLFILPASAASEAAWQETDLHASAKRIPGLTLHTDINRRESELFGARTSGMCLLYDPSGALVFHGGLTEARGHEGENEGTDAIRTILAGSQDELRQSPVYGCPLFETSTGSEQANCTTNEAPNND
jgi:hypothetical protein